MKHIDAFESIQRECRRGEQIVWVGRPRPGVYLRPADAFLVPFSILWGGFAIFWEASVIAGGAPVLMALWGIPFVLVGLHFMIGRFFVDAMARGRTVYGLTNERIIVLSGLFSSSVSSYLPTAIPEIRLVEHSDGTGTIDLAPAPWMNQFSRGSGRNPWAGWSATMIERIPDARSVYRQILAFQQGGRGSPARPAST